MQLPENALFCIQRLENAGFAAYAVGGCVRDALLGLQPHDYDLCTAATPSKIKEIFQDFPQIHAGEKHGTIGIIFPNHEVYEITTFRTEGSYADGRHPDWVEFVPDIGQDLARRDFTVNAMACSPLRGLTDPFGGQDDLSKGILRTVGQPRRRFSEDALRILRGVRFSVTYHLTVEEETGRAMAALAPLMDNLARERVFDELCKLLPRMDAPALVTFAPVFTQIIPELKPCMGFQQHNPHHIHDVYTHIAHVVQNTPPELELRWAALLHDVGKPDTFTLDEAGVGHFYGHAAHSAALAGEILLRLKAPTALRQQVVALVELHMTQIPAEKKAVRRFLSRHGEKTLRQLLLLQQADQGSKAPADTDYFAQTEALCREITAENDCLSLKNLAVNGHDLMALGYQGPEVGAALNGLLEAVLDDRVSNEKTALLTYLSHLFIKE